MLPKETVNHGMPELIQTAERSQFITCSTSPLPAQSVFLAVRRLPGCQDFNSPAPAAAALEWFHFVEQLHRCLDEAFPATRFERTGGGFVMALLEGPAGGDVEIQVIGQRNDNGRAEG